MHAQGAAQGLEGDHGSCAPVAFPILKPRARPLPHPTSSISSAAQQGPCGVRAQQGRATSHRRRIAGQVADSQHRLPLNNSTRMLPTGSCEPHAPHAQAGRPSPVLAAHSRVHPTNLAKAPAAHHTAGARVREGCLQRPHSAACWPCHVEAQWPAIGVEP